MCWAAIARAEVKLASPFGDHMVLQRDQPLRIFGTAAAGRSVTVAIADQSATATVDADGKFVATLKPLAAGGPFKLEAKCGSDVATIDDVLVGDVWLCSGQSNMQMSLKEVANADAEIATAKDHPKLRLLTVARGFNDKVQSSFGGEWKACSPASAADFSAVAYLFAHELSRDRNLADVPIGLIDSSFGGSAIEGWIPASQIPPIPADQQSKSMFGVPSGFYNAMIAPLGSLNLKGVVWYQGESNASHPQPYAKLLTKMIEVWRKQFESKDLPFLIVELPPNDGDWGGYYFVWLREMQRQVAATVPHASLATTIGTCDGTDLHPKEKHEIGTRLARLAWHDVYGEDGIIPHGPTLKSVRIDGTDVHVLFNVAGTTLGLDMPQPLSGFQLAGEDGRFFFADASKEAGDGVLVHSDSVPRPKFVRYGWRPIPQASVWDGGHQYSGPFRTDDLPVEPLAEVLRQPVPRKIVMPDYEMTISGAGKVTDLIVHGQQFLSNAAGTWGGTSIPQGWGGTRALRDVQELGPGSVRFSDNEFSLTLDLETRQQIWQMSNTVGDDKNLRLALAPQVTVTNDGDALELHRGDATLKIQGITVINQTPEGGKLLEIKVPAKGSATLSLVIP